MMTRRREARRSGTSGQSLTELALILPLLLLLVLGVADVGMAISTNSALVYVTREAARELEGGAIAPSDPDPGIIQDITATLQQNGLDLTGLQSVTIFNATANATVARKGGDPCVRDVWAFSSGHVTTSPSPPTTCTTPPCATSTYPNTYPYTCRNPGDHIGVMIVYHYRGITPLYVGGLTEINIANTQIDDIPSFQNGSSGSSLPTPAPAPTLAPTPLGG